MKSFFLLLLIFFKFFEEATWKFPLSTVRDFENKLEICTLYFFLYVPALFFFVIFITLPLCYFLFKIFFCFLLVIFSVIRQLYWKHTLSFWHLLHKKKCICCILKCLLFKGTFSLSGCQIFEIFFYFNLNVFLVHTFLWF